MRRIFQDYGDSLTQDTADFESKLVYYLIKYNKYFNDL